MIPKVIKFRATAKSNPQVAEYLNAAKKAKQAQHVVPKDGEWAVKKSLSSRRTKTFSTQKEAIGYARNIARNQQTELFIHGRNGQIRERNSYGNDSFPPRG